MIGLKFLCYYLVNAIQEPIPNVQFDDWQIRRKIDFRVFFFREIIRVVLKSLKKILYQ